MLVASKQFELEQVLKYRTEIETDTQTGVRRRKAEFRACL